MKMYEDFLSALGFRESGNDYTNTNAGGKLGRFQFAEDALQDIGFYSGDKTKGKDDWAGKWTGQDDVHSREEFLASPAAQDHAIKLYIEKQLVYMHRLKLDKYIGQTINGVVVTESGLVAAAHLGGVGDLKKYLVSGGTFEFADDNGTKLSSSLKTSAGMTSVTST